MIRVGKPFTISSDVIWTKLAGFDGLMRNDKPHRSDHGCVQLDETNTATMATRLKCKRKVVRFSNLTEPKKN